ncbi:BON domain-containing protein [Chryseolinea lacunae]|uniref:BON domain-containing protein n=1 Tax=Chryseolinea lacunae TaxID=2801331 RepID=A0ABS1KTA1_9BACT|nr:BON domain-containing protein [Chryseolinea lacunae]MBL0742690.1 BON domain-containing protein [Chryseolinea lacunae]
MTKTNEQLQKDIQTALVWEPLLHATQIDVSVKDGIVTLSGIVDSYSKKTEAELAVKNITGVKAVVDRIDVAFGNEKKVTDAELTRVMMNALKWNGQVPQGHVTLKVEDGWITLTGELPWHYQRVAAEHAVTGLTGVKGISMNITIKSESKAAVEAVEIENALKRHWSINAENINVNVTGTRVTLGGIVTSWYERDAASKIAWQAPGVESVENKLSVEHDYSWVAL